MKKDKTPLSLSINHFFHSEVKKYFHLHGTSAVTSNGEWSFKKTPNTFTLVILPIQNCEQTLVWSN